MTDRKTIPTATRLRLFAEAAGHCQNPDCLDRLFPPDMGGNKHIAEMAHLIPYGDSGPRHEDRPEGDFNADLFENLILLCPTCHTRIDKAPDAYPRSMLLGWKNNHIANLALNLGIRSYESRALVRQAVSRLLTENSAIWHKYAPGDGSEFEYDPESGVAAVWTQRMRSVILPNLYRILDIVEANIGLATQEERQAFADFKEHVRGLTERHICGIAGRVIRFPERMEWIFL